jgi:hypothetical protein
MIYRYSSKIGGRCAYGLASRAHKQGSWSGCSCLSKTGLRWIRKRMIQQLEQLVSGYTRKDAVI